MKNGLQVFVAQVTGGATICARRRIASQELSLMMSCELADAKPRVMCGVAQSHSLSGRSPLSGHIGEHAMGAWPGRTMLSHCLCSPARLCCGTSACSEERAPACTCARASAQRWEHGACPTTLRSHVGAEPCVVPQPCRADPVIDRPRHEFLAGRRACIRRWRPDLVLRVLHGGQDAQYC